MLWWHVNLSDRKRNLFFLVIITSTMIMEPSKLRFSMFVSLCFFVIALINIHSPFWRLSCVRDAQTVTQWVSGLLKSYLQTCSSWSAADGGLKRIHVPEFRLCLVGQCIVKCQARLSRGVTFFPFNPHETRNCAPNNRSVFSCVTS